LIQWGRSAKTGKVKFDNVTILQQFKLYLDENLKASVNDLPMDLTPTDIIAGNVIINKPVVRLFFSNEA
jgi:hypothetical protein